MPISILDWTLAGTPNVPAGDGSLPIIPYVRVSTEKQAKEGVSLSVQQAAIVAWAKERGVELDEFVIDVKSGESIFGRPCWWIFWIGSSETKPAESSCSTGIAWRGAGA
jgi:hypothetical protein